MGTIVLGKVAITAGMASVRARTDMLNKRICATVLLSFLLLSGCSNTMPEATEAASGSTPNASFVSGMGCDDPSCTDPSHYHDCPPDCAEYEHHHHCGLDCDDPSHDHHSNEHSGAGHHSDHN